MYNYILKQRSKKGFTLVELVIVIAVIAILAAVLIPTFSNVIEDSRLSADQSDAKTMSSNLKVHMALNEVTYTEASEVVHYLTGAGFSLETRSSKTSFWYDRATQNIIVAENDVVFSARGEVGFNYSGRYAYADETTTWTNDRLEALSVAYPAYLYIDQADRPLKRSIDIISDLPGAAGSGSGAEYLAVVQTMRTLFDETVVGIREQLDMEEGDFSTITAMLSTYNPNSCLYIDSVSQYTSAILDAEGGLSTDNAVTVARVHFIQDTSVTTQTVPTAPDALKTKTLYVGTANVGGGEIVIPTYITGFNTDALTNIVNTTVTIQNETLFNTLSTNSQASTWLSLSNIKAPGGGGFAYTTLAPSCSYNQYETRTYNNFSQFDRYTFGDVGVSSDIASVELDKTSGLLGAYLIPTLVLQPTYDALDAFEVGCYIKDGDIYIEVSQPVSSVFGDGIEYFVRTNGVYASKEASVTAPVEGTVYYTSATVDGKTVYTPAVYDPIGETTYYRASGTMKQMMADAREGTDPDNADAPGAITGFDYIQISSIDYGSVVVVKGAFTIGNKVYRFQDVGFFKQISCYTILTPTGTYICVNNPVRGFDLSNLQGLTVKLAYDNLGAGEHEMSLEEGRYMKLDDGNYNYYEVRIYQGTTLIFRQLI